MIYHIDAHSVVRLVDEYMMPAEMPEYLYFDGNENYPIELIKTIV